MALQTSQETSPHPDTPVRMYMEDPDIHWRMGFKPSYDMVNRKYLNERTQRHLAGSLEKIVENLVKTWEMESTHKIDPKDWKTVDHERYHFSTNGGPRKDLAENIQLGNYNMLMEHSPLFDVTKETNASSHALFKTAFPGGFPWELIELASGPPKVAFTWRHWTHWTGPYKGNAPTGELIEIFGMCLAVVNEDLKITDLQIYFDPNPTIAKLMNFKIGDFKGCPMSSAAVSQEGGCPFASSALQTTATVEPEQESPQEVPSSSYCNLS